jgi:hypothetical protein
MRKNKLTLYDCERCKFTFKKVSLRRQRGMLLCDACFDSVLEIEPVNARFLSPRANSTSIAAVSSPTVFTITTAGVTALSQSQTFTREGVTNSFVMHVQGSPTTITANPQIVAGRQGTLLTLVGTSDTNYLIVSTGNGTDLSSQMVLKNGNTLSLVYNSTSSLWCETSRS